MHVDFVDKHKAREWFPRHWVSFYDRLMSRRREGYKVHLPTLQKGDAFPGISLNIRLTFENFLSSIKWVDLWYQVMRRRSSIFIHVVGDWGGGWGVGSGVGWRRWWNSWEFIKICPFCWICFKMSIKSYKHLYSRTFMVKCRMFMIEENYEPFWTVWKAFVRKE